MILDFKMANIRLTYESDSSGSETENSSHEPQHEPHPEQTPQLNSYNLTKASTSGWSEINEQPPSKAFVVMRKNKNSVRKNQKYMMKWWKG